MSEFHTFSQSSHEKSKAALTSVLAALFLVVFKIIVGFFTKSLGILAEAAHSGLDLIAALMTLYAVRWSSQPADTKHRYGHGKIENLSALFETLILLITCFWIFHAAVNRIISGKLEVEVTIWSFAVMIISIIVDISRSKLLYATAHKYKSQALEADALHFSTDIWSSSVVILGLICVLVSEWFPQLSFLKYADAIAAVFVGMIVVFVSWRLCVRAINALLDAAPDGVEEKVRSLVCNVNGICNCHDVRVRASGADIFIDLHILVDGNMPLKKAHQLTEEIENLIKNQIPNADITVHPEPK